MSASSSDTSVSLVSSSSRCWLAIITEVDACETEKRMEVSYAAIAKAVSEQPDAISIVSIRLKPSDSAEVLNRAVELTKRLVQLSEKYGDRGRSSSIEDQELPPCPTFKVVCSSDWVEAAVLGGAHGVHVKEHHLPQIPSIREQFSVTNNSTNPIWIGTSAHSVESALISYGEYEPDYYFVGTCFLTASHPEKTSEADLEGPSLPGKVRRALHAAAVEQQRSSNKTPPKVMAIGGIDESNCHIPVELGADGVAVIRSVLQAKDPAKAVADMQYNMKSAVTGRATKEGAESIAESSPSS
ncbi:MAG: hypothetical protein SGBAC_008937 [Bacillariaceae sp.]